MILFALMTLFESLQNIMGGIIGRGYSALALAYWAVRGYLEYDKEQIGCQGLPNIGNTCFSNVIIQSLYWTPNFKRLLDVGSLWHPDKTSVKESLTSAMLDILNQLKDSTTTVEQQRVTLKALLKTIRQIDPKFKKFHQQDSYELFNTIINGIDKEIEKASASKRSRDKDVVAVRQLFEGCFITTYRYSGCTHVDVNFQKFTSINVQIVEILPVNMTEPGQCSGTQTIIDSTLRTNNHFTAQPCFDTEKKLYPDLTTTANDTSSDCSSNTNKLIRIGDIALENKFKQCTNIDYDLNQGKHSDVSISNVQNIVRLEGKNVTGAHTTISNAYTEAKYSVVEESVTKLNGTFDLNINIATDVEEEKVVDLGDGKPKSEFNETEEPENEVEKETGMDEEDVTHPTTAELHDNKETENREVEDNAMNKPVTTHSIYSHLHKNNEIENRIEGGKIVNENDKIHLPSKLNGNVDVKTESATEDKSKLKSKEVDDNHHGLQLDGCHTDQDVAITKTQPVARKTEKDDKNLPGFQNDDSCFRKEQQLTEIRHEAYMESQLPAAVRTNNQDIKDQSGDQSDSKLDVKQTLNENRTTSNNNCTEHSNNVDNELITITWKVPLDSKNISKFPYSEVQMNDVNKLVPSSNIDQSGNQILGEQTISDHVSDFCKTSENGESEHTDPKYCTDKCMTNESMNRQHTDVNEGLRSLLKTKDSDGHAFTCKKCPYKETRCSTTMEILIPPPILVLHINKVERSTDGCLQKLHTDVTYPEHIDLDKNDVFSTDTFKIWRNKSSNTAYSTQYRLYSVVCHRGTMNAGHYFAYIRNTIDNDKLLELAKGNVFSEEDMEEVKRHIQGGIPKEKYTVIQIEESQSDNCDWFKFSDSLVRQANADEALKSDCACMLFYEMIPVE